MSPPALVILAAGIGSRYGGPKQLERVGPGGATLMDYSVYDARRAGFEKVVFIVRPDLETTFRTLIRERYRARIDATVALQRLDDVARTKPWGTGHAVLAAESEIQGAFAVVNADDFYGRGAFAMVAEFLKGGQGVSPFANVGYPLRETVSTAGGVNRAVCRASTDGWLEALEEIVGIRRLDDGTYAGADARGRPVAVPDDALVSMNMWAFTPAVFAMLRRAFVEFLEQPDAHRREFLIPDAIQGSVLRGEARVRMLCANSRWLGMTYPEDRPRVEASLRELVTAGEYPERLWE
jgi:choline kinase